MMETISIVRLINNNNRNLHACSSYCICLWWLAWEKDIKFNMLVGHVNEIQNKISMGLASHPDRCGDCSVELMKRERRRSLGAEKQRDSIHGISFDPDEQLSTAEQHGSGEPTSLLTRNQGRCMANSK
jgi:hypothetical protein